MKLVLSLEPWHGHQIAARRFGGIRSMAAKLNAALALSVLATVLHVDNAQAADASSNYPNRVIKIIVPNPAGGSTDVLARLLGQKMQDRWGQAVVVENRTGASGIIGANAAAKSEPDGYTLLLATNTALAVAPFVFKSLPYDPERDFTPVILASVWPSIVVVNNSLPVSSMEDLNQYLKARPGQASYSSAGIGTPSHLGVEMYEKQMGIEMTHVPYRGGPPAIAGLMGGQTTVMFAIWPDAVPLVRAGKLKALAVTTAQRSVLEPSLPTMAESGVPGYDLVAWVAVVAPKGTPKEIVAKVNKLLDEALHEREVRDRLTGMGFEVGGGTPERLGELMHSEAKKWERVVREANIPLQ